MHAPVPPVPLVLLHGLLSSAREFSLVAPVLRASGVTVVTPAVAGYTEGRATGPRDWREWLDAAERAVRDAVEPGTPFVLGGLCCGGLLAAALAARGRLPLHGLAMLSPTFAFDGWARSSLWRWRRVAYALGLARCFSVAERPPYGVKNERMRRWIAHDLQQRATSSAGPARLPLRAIEQNERLAAHVARVAPMLDLPTVVVHARDDELCSLAAVERVFATMPPGRRRLVVLDESYHMVTLDDDRARVVEALRVAVGLRPVRASTAVPPPGRRRPVHAVPDPVPTGRRAAGA